MMKKLLLLLIFTVGLMHSQVQQGRNANNPKSDVRDPKAPPVKETVYLSPEGMMDNLFDHYGNRYTLNDIKIPVRGEKDTASRILLACDTGIFNLYYEPGSGLEDPAKQAVVCRVFKDISNFLNTPLSSNSVKVNIWVRNINSLLGANALNPNPAQTSNVLGMASAFYNMPNNSTLNFGGIADNEIWKTVHAGVDSYTNVISLLGTENPYDISPAGIFFHGMMAFNFRNPNINWNLNMGINAPTGSYDLYSVLLHEITHALGFSSMIDANGDSRFGVGYKYYSRYDKLLKNANSTQFLINNPSSCSTMYNFRFNSALLTSVLHPSATCGTDETICGNALRYGSSNIPVYTPNCFELGSSLSHFEDQSYPTCNMANNNLYFVMSNVAPTGTSGSKRYLKPEERQVLCDIGYSVKTTFGNVSTFNGTYNYGGSSCAGITVAGINDGVTGGIYTNVVTAGGSVNLANFLNNDYPNNDPSMSFECLQDVYDTSVSLLASGTQSTVVSFSSINPGLHLLRYVPVYGGQRGNITYIYVYVLNANCNPSPCEIINNGGFENSSNCGQYNDVPNPVINCWSRLSLSPDLYKRNCTNPNLHVHVPTDYSIPSSDTWNNGLNGNNTMLGLWSDQGTYFEAMQNILNAPIQPNVEYVLRFKARVMNNFNTCCLPAQNLPTKVFFGGTASMLAYFNGTTFIPPSITPLASVDVANNNQWNSFSVPLNSTTTTLNYLQVINDYNIGTTQSSNSVYVIVDDISIIPLSQTSNIVIPTVCLSQTLSDLNNYLAPAPTGGTFSGPGVSGTTFNASVAGVGTHLITYSYSNNIGCATSITATVTVSACSASSCPGDLLFNSVEASLSASYQAANTIVATGGYTVNSPSVITLKAGNSITFYPETKVSAGSHFTAAISQCIQTSARTTEDVAIKDDASLIGYADAMTIHPNPANFQTTIAISQGEMKRLTVASIDGKLIYTGAASGNTFDLDISSYQNGIYLITVETADGKIFREKIIKN
jgi:plastocyanin